MVMISFRFSHHFRGRQLDNLSAAGHENPCTETPSQFTGRSVGALGPHTTGLLSQLWWFPQGPSLPSKPEAARPLQEQGLMLAGGGLDCF